MAKQNDAASSCISVVSFPDCFELLVLLGYCKLDKLMDSYPLMSRAQSQFHLVEDHDELRCNI